MTQLPSDEQIRAELAAVRSRVLAATATTHSPRAARRTRVIRTTAILGVAVIATTSLAALTTHQVGLQLEQLNSLIECHSSTAGGDIVYVDFVPDEGTNSSFRPPDGDPGFVLEVCADMWRNGSFVPGTSGLNPNDPSLDFPVPPLTACVTPSEIPAVYPNHDDESATELCGALGLAVWDLDSGV